MLVSRTAVGPVGTTGGWALLVVLGASGSWSVAGAGGGVDCCGVWAREDAVQASRRAMERRIMRCKAPTDRLSQTRGWSNAGGFRPAILSGRDLAGGDGVLKPGP